MSLTGNRASRSSPQAPCFKGPTKTLTQRLLSKAPDRILPLANDQRNGKLRKAQSVFLVEDQDSAP
jgi:hypothetical protein